MMKTQYPGRTLLEKTQKFVLLLKKVHILQMHCLHN